MVVAKKQMYVEQPEYNQQEPTQRKIEVKKTVSATQVLHQRVVPVLLVSIIFVLAIMLIIRYTKITSMQVDINKFNQELNKEVILTDQLKLELSRCYDSDYIERSLIIQQNMEHVGQEIIYVDLNNNEMMVSERETDIMN